MKISFLVPSISTNCLGRAYMLAKVLSRRYEVELIGPTLWGRGIWKPCDTGEFTYKVIEWRGPKTLRKATKEILSSITGSVIYAMKPMFTSYGVALIRKLTDRTPVILDIDDWEVGFLHERWRTARGSLIRGSDLPWATLVLDRLVRCADDVTVVSDFLLRKYGGNKIPHGRDTELFDPALYDRLTLRETHGLSGWKVIMFLGSLQIYKGLEDLLEAVRSLPRRDVRVMLIGANKEEPYVRKLMSLGGEHLQLVEMQPFADIPKWLSMADMVVLPQRASPGAIGQVPAKIFDAMAMAKPVISTAVSDIPEILEGCGIVAEPGNVQQLAEKIEYLLDHEEEAALLGAKARERCIERYSYYAVERALPGIFAKYA